VLYITSEFDPCANVVGGKNCSQICRLDTENNPYCVCNVGYELGTDTETCLGKNMMFCS